MLYLLFDQLRGWLDARGLYMGLFEQVEFRALAASLLAFFVVVALGKPVINWLTRLKVGDAGRSDAAALRAHAASKANVPTMGGLLILAAVLTGTLLLADISRARVIFAVVVLVWLGTLGAFDDWLKLTAARRGTGRQGLFAWEKLAFQLALGLLIGFFLYREGDTTAGADIAHVLNIPLQRTYEPGGAGIAEGLVYMSRGVFVLVSVLLIAGMSNAVNITDGMDGLASGITTTVAFGLMLLALVAGSEGMAQYLLVPHVAFADELAVVAGSMAGACLGFLWWNCAPAHVFMGDTGSLPLGGLIAYIAIAIRQELVMVLMCGVFLVEIASVVMQVGYFKATGGKRIFKCAPYHHHLHLSDWTESQVVSRLWIVSILLTVLAIVTLKIR
ncbi:MAG: phospho-N-acetylmuramoyl-pentapeptide-transferase [Phycisphaerae bacterium]|nr:phospho-N-acetylmuramoyl-pentapeptide-transferase [Phycisphaerae bacterium]